MKGSTTALTTTLAAAAGAILATSFTAPAFADDPVTTWKPAASTDTLTLGFPSQCLPGGRCHYYVVGKG